MNISKAIIQVLAVILLIVTIGVISEDSKVSSTNLTVDGWKPLTPGLVNPDSISVNHHSMNSAFDHDFADIATGNKITQTTYINDPYADTQWALNKISLYQAWQITSGNPTVIVAILDTGIDSNHEDLNHKVLSAINFTDSHTSSDINGHGTHIAGIIGAENNNKIGISGVAPKSKILNVKVADDKGRCTSSSLVDGIEWAVENDANIINISIELRESSLDLVNAIDYAWNQGAIIISAAGNDASSLPAYPAYYENCMSVAGITENDNLAPLSNYGDWVNVAAPGCNILSTLPVDTYGYKTGTSFASAYVSGAAALLFDMVTDTNNNGRLNDEVRTALENGCQDIDTPGVGKGRIDIMRSFYDTGNIY